MDPFDQTMRVIFSAVAIVIVCAFAHDYYTDRLFVTSGYNQEMVVGSHDPIWVKK